MKFLNILDFFYGFFLRLHDFMDELHGNHNLNDATRVVSIYVSISFIYMSGLLCLCLSEYMCVSVSMCVCICLYIFPLEISTLNIHFFTSTFYFSAQIRIVVGYILGGTWPTLLALPETVCS